VRLRFDAASASVWLSALVVFSSPFLGGRPDLWRGALLGGLLFLALAASPVFEASGAKILPFSLGVLLALSALWSDRWADSLAFGLAYLGILSLPLLPLEEGPLVFALLLSALLSSLWGVVDFSLAGSPTWRVFGPFVNPNMFACFLIPAVVLGGHVAIFGGRSLRLLGAVAALLSLASLGLTGSRGGALGLFVALACYGASLRRRALPVVAVVSLLALLAFLSPLRYRLVGAQIPHSHLFRLAVWGSTIDALSSRPWGWGFTAFEEVYPSFARAGFTRMAHSVYLQLAMEVGPLGGALLLALLALGGRGLARGRREGAAALLGQGVHFLVESALYIPAVAVEFSLLYAISAGRGRARPLPSALRVCFGAAAAFLLLVASSGMLVEAGRRAASGGDLLSAREKTEAAASLFPLSAEAW